MQVQVLEHQMVIKNIDDFVNAIEKTLQQLNADGLDNVVLTFMENVKLKRLL